MSRLVSIITPVYNSEKYIGETIESIIQQTYSNFELLIVDDCSTDNSYQVIEEYLKMDSRIKYFCLNKNSGAAVARNFAIKEAKGTYIAFLDADDLWDTEKLQKQITFMEEYNLDFTYTNYRYILENGTQTNKYKSSFKELSFIKILFFSSSIGCLTVIYNQENVGEIQIPPLKKRNDVAIWHHVLKKTKKGYLFDEILASHRIVPGSLSRSTGKIKILKYHYQLYRRNLNFGSFTSGFLTISNAVTYIFIKLFMEKKF